jgi:hypothetical protein
MFTTESLLIVVDAMNPFLHVVGKSEMGLLCTCQTSKINNSTAINCSKIYFCNSYLQGDREKIPTRLLIMVLNFFLLYFNLFGMWAAFGPSRLAHI